MTATISIKSALGSAEPTLDLFDLLPPKNERTKTEVEITTDSSFTGNIRFEKVSFRYPGSDKFALKEFSLNVESGQTIAIVGPSGAGKTTISALIPRLYDVTGGSIEIDGHDIRDLTLESLRDSIGVVMQDAHLFHESIAENLRYAKQDATLEEMQAACEAAQIWKLIESLPNGLDTMVGERGHRLSGGEKQRLAIARLLLKSPAVVILDEATAHLDSENEQLVHAALQTALKGRTSIVIAHRLSTVRDADQILVLEKGSIIERGKHDELVAKGGLYSELYNRQDLTGATN